MGWERQGRDNSICGTGAGRDREETIGWEGQERDDKICGTGDWDGSSKDDGLGGMRR